MIFDYAFSAGVFYGLPKEITTLDLSFANIKFINLPSKEFERKQRTIHHKTDWESLHSYSFFNQAYKTLGYNPTEMWVAFPINVKKGLSLDTLRQLETLLLIMFPSHCKILLEVTYTESEYENKYRETGSANYAFSTNKNNSLVSTPLQFSQHEKLAIIKFLKLSFKRFDSLKKDYEILFECYQHSFYHWSIEMAIVSLSMALESLIKAQSEISHQIARTCAIINAKDKVEGRLIYSNTKKLYDIRSRIVHGNKPKNISLNKHYTQLQALVSRTIIEIFALNIRRTDLVDLVVESGYGERDKFSNEYRSPVFNHTVLNNMLMYVEKLK